MNKRYFLHPGEIRSINDNDLHYITAPELARLYGLDYKQCHVMYDEYPERCNGYVHRYGDIHLYPQRSGNYDFIK